jgi:hypothetical protein
MACSVLPIRLVFRNRSNADQLAASSGDRKTARRGSGLFRHVVDVLETLLLQIQVSRSTYMYLASPYPSVNRERACSKQDAKTKSLYAPSDTNLEDQELRAQSDGLCVRLSSASECKGVYLAHFNNHVVL